MHRKKTSASPRRVYHQATWIAVALLALSVLTLGGCCRFCDSHTTTEGWEALVVLAGSTYLETESASQYIEIPAGAFGPGTDAFKGVVEFVGEPAIPGSNADTELKILENLRVGDTVDILLATFWNRSREPITITGTGSGAGRYHMTVSTSPTVPTKGTMTLLSLDQKGGAYSAHLVLQPYFEFLPVDGQDTIKIDTADPPIPGFPIWIGSSKAFFTLSPPKGALVNASTSNFFYDGDIRIVRTDVDGGELYACAKRQAIAMR